MQLATVLLLINGLLAFSSDDSRPHVSKFGGGTPAESGQYPWMILLKIGGDESLLHFRDGVDNSSVNWATFDQRCGGSLLAIPGDHKSSDIVLTAAHCIVYKFPELELSNKRDLTLYAGVHFANESDQGVKRGVKRMAFHPEYQQKFYVGSPYDIAVIQLDSPIQFNDEIQPIALPDKGRVLLDYDNCTIAGWGLVAGSGTGAESAIVLNHMNVTIMPYEHCEAFTLDGWMHVDGSRTYCIYPIGGEEVPSACTGDSGSPLMCEDDSGRMRAHGVLSFADINCSGRDEKHESKPSVYIRTVEYADWINEKIRDWSAVCKCSLFGCKAAQVL